jgi:hypothetical protein
VDEQQWLSEADPSRMLGWLRREGKLSDRKARLFAAACCRELADYLSDRYARRALVIAERYADGDIALEKLAFAGSDARRAAHGSLRRRKGAPDGTAMWAVSLVCAPETEQVLSAPEMAARCRSFPPVYQTFAKLRKEQADMLRDVLRTRSASSLPTRAG